MATADQQAQFKLDNWQHALAVSQQTGVDPRIVMAQAGVESDWGNAAPGNNVFGVKGAGQTLPTQEAGPGGILQNTTASFRAYPSTAHSFADYANLPVVQKVGTSGDYNSQIKALGQSGYASDPNYGSKIDAAAKDLTIPQGVSASVLPIVQSTNINGVGAGGNGTMAVTPPPPDPRTAGDADLGGYGMGNPLPGGNPAGLLALAQQRAIADTMSKSQGLLAAGNAQQPTQQQQIPMMQQHRGQRTALPTLIPTLLPPNLLG